jgi:hypothetical protein
MSRKRHCLCVCNPKGSFSYGLLRRCAPRNDDGLLTLCTQSQRSQSLATPNLRLTTSNLRLRAQRSNPFVACFCRHPKSPAGHCGTFRTLTTTVCYKKHQSIYFGTIIMHKNISGLLYKIVPKEKPSFGTSKTATINPASANS